MNTLPLMLDNLEQKVQQLPSLSAIIARLLNLLQREDISMKVLIMEISKDQALMARILRIANSPFYGLSSRISSLQHAGILLGLHSLQGIITATGVMGHFPAGQDQVFNRQSFWQHAIGTGIAAQVLARHSGLDVEQAFTAGLLHDIGKLVLVVYFENEFIQVLAWRDEHDCLIREAEQAVLGYDHAEIGACVARHWKLPKLLVNAIQFHHSLPDEASPLSELVHVADILCRGLNIGHGGDDLIPLLQPIALSRLGLEWTDLQAALPEIERLNASAGLLLENSA